jgi:hypothetical protein
VGGAAHGGELRQAASVSHEGKNELSGPLPRKHATLIETSERIAKARQIVAAQEALIATLKAANRPTADAEANLHTYLTPLWNLEDHERRTKPTTAHSPTGSRSCKTNRYIGPTPNITIGFLYSRYMS